MSMIEAVKTWLATCPQLTDERLNVDFLTEDSGSYSVDVVPAEPIIKRYIGGDTQRQFLFMVSSRNAYGADVLQNLENLGFYEDFAAWVESQSNAKILPALGSGLKAQKVEALTPGYAFDANGERARYQIQLRMVYHAERS